MFCYLFCFFLIFFSCFGPFCLSEAEFVLIVMTWNSCHNPLNASWIMLPQSLFSTPCSKPSPTPLVDLILIPTTIKVCYAQYKEIQELLFWQSISQGWRVNDSYSYQTLAVLAIWLLNIVKITVKEPLKKVFQRANQGIVGRVWFTYRMLEQCFWR